MLVTMPNVLCKFHATVCRRYSPFLVRCCTRSRLVRRPTCTGLVDIRLLSASVSDTDEQTIVSARRRYLEVWAGIRRGELSKSAPADHSSVGKGSAPYPSSGYASPRPRTMPGRREACVYISSCSYLVTTLQIPPLPSADAWTEAVNIRVQGRESMSSGRDVSESAGEDRQELREAENHSQGTAARTHSQGQEQHVLKWMKGVLEGNSDSWVTRIVRRTGLPVVLDLGAMSQDGSPHKKPVDRASLAGVVKAVQASGLVPIGVCNASHDVAALASDLGLQQVMKAGPRSRAPAPTSAPSSATACRSVGRRSHGNPSPDHPEPLGSLGAVGVTLAHEGAAGEETARLGVSEGMRTGKAACSNPWVGSDEHLQERAQPLEDDLQANVGESQVEHACMPGGRETRVYHGSVRSGQQVAAHGGSLVVIGGVNSGGEVMADDDIHVYGPLRGRAMAGLSGDSSAKIFTTAFDAELVGIADAFTTCEDPDSLPGLVAKAPTSVSVENGKLVFQSFEM